MCQAYCQAHKLERSQVYCGTCHQAGVYGMTGGRTQSGDQDAGKRNGRPKLVGDDGNEMMGDSCQKASKRPCHWLAIRGTESHSYKDIADTQQTFITTPDLPERYKGPREPGKAPEAVPKPKGK